MATLRDDLVGEVWGRDKDGARVVLKAGDSIPVGMEVEDDLLADEKPKSANKK